MKRLLVTMIVLLTFFVFLPGRVFGASIQVNRDNGTYDGGSSSEKYTAFKIFDASKNGNAASYHLPANSKFAFIRNDSNVLNYLTFAAASDGSGWSVTWKEGVASSEANAIALARTLWDLITYTGNGYTVENDRSLVAGVDFFSLPIGEARTPVPEGYYLIQSTLGTNLALVTTDVVITEKNHYPGILKEFSDGMAVNAKREEDSSFDEVQIRDTVSYTLTVTIPESSNQTIIITDTMDSGLDALVYQTTDDRDTATYTTDADKVGKVIVTAQDSSGDPVSNFTTSTVTDHVFTIMMTSNQVTSLAGETITFEYQATVNGEAGLTPTQENTAHLNYGSFYETADHTVSSVTRNLTINKNDGSNPLMGAQFEIRRDSQNSNAIRLVRLTDANLEAAGITKANDTIYYRVADGKDAGSVATIDMTAAYSAVIYGLDDDSNYIITETKAPAGFNKLDHNETSNGGADADRVVNVTNQAGSLLPSTGGRGSRFLYLTGAILMIGGGLVLAKRKLMDGK